MNLIFRFAREVIFSSANLCSRFVILLLIHSIRQRSLASGYAVAPDVAGRHKGDACLRSPQNNFYKFFRRPQLRGFIASKQLFKVTYLILIQSRCRREIPLCCAPQSLSCRTHSRKEVFQPHLPVRLPCYDLAPVTRFTLGRSLRSRTSGTPSFHGLTGGVYKARERIHRAMADARLLANPASRSRVADSDPN